MKYNPKILRISTLAQAEKEIRKVNPESTATKIMAQKAVFRIVKLHKVRNAMASILKQEMLALGGDAAVSRNTVNCKDPNTDVVLMGTIKHYNALIQKMSYQVSESKAIARAVKNALKRDI